MGNYIIECEQYEQIAQRLAAIAQNPNFAKIAPKWRKRANKAWIYKFLRCMYRANINSFNAKHGFSYVYDGEYTPGDAIQWRTFDDLERLSLGMELIDDQIWSGKTRRIKLLQAWSEFCFVVDSFIHEHAATLPNVVYISDYKSNKG